MKNGEIEATFPRELADPAFEYCPGQVPDWTPQESVATVIALASQLTSIASDQAAAGAAREAIDDDAKFADLWSRRPLEDSAILPLDWVPPSPALAGLFVWNFRLQ